MEPHYLSIRQEIETDHQAVFNLIENAFQLSEMSDHSEQFLVQRLRKSDAFIPELSLVAELDDKIVGHILLTKLIIKNGDQQFDSLALAPVSVLPNYQRQGIGGQLIKAAHEIAKQLNHQSVILLGHRDYYPRFGYQPAHLFGIALPFDVPKENCMAIELVENGLQKVSGLVEYPAAFSV